MKNLTVIPNNTYVTNGDNLYLYFYLDSQQYAVSLENVVEIIKLPRIDYPQKLINNIVGILNYNNLTINILDLRFYLNKKVSGYTVDNKLIIVRTDESIFGIIIDEIGDIINIESAFEEPLNSFEKINLIESLYRRKDESSVISIINLTEVENIIKGGDLQIEEVDIPSLFPQDGESIQKFLQRSLELENKFQSSLAQNVFSQGRFMTCQLSSGIFCFNLNEIKEVLKNVKITNVPCTPDYIRGLISLRGNFITVVDLKKFLELSIEKDAQNQNSKSENKIIIVEKDDVEIGFLVDEILDIIDIPEELILKNPAHNLNKYIKSEVVMDDKLYTIFDSAQIFGDEKLYINENV
jgi:purine-binding chemotaxis protein CheW